MQDITLPTVSPEKIISVLKTIYSELAAFASGLSFDTMIITIVVLAALWMVASRLRNLLIFRILRFAADIAIVVVAVLVLLSVKDQAAAFLGGVM
jgi:hypothetical protein